MGCPFSLALSCEKEEKAVRKLTRGEKIKLGERIKTVVIVLLTVSCLVSGYYMFDMYRDQGGVGSLWWSGDNAATAGEDNSHIASPNTFNSFLTLSQPELIMINRIGNRDKVLAEDEDFAKTAELVNTVMKEVYLRTEQSFDTVNAGEWENAVKSNSVYVRYAGKRSTGFEAEFYKITASKLAAAIDEYEEFAIIPNKKAKELTVYIPNSGYKSIVRVKLETSLAETVAAVIEARADITTKKYAFAFELNLTSRTDSLDKTKPRAQLSPMFVIPTTPDKAFNIIADVPKVYKNGLSFTKTTDFTTGLINIFGYNPNTIRQYANSDNALIFVGETGTLSVYPEGYIEYQALGQNEGVLLAGQTQPDAYNITSGLIGMLERIYSLSGVIPEYNDSSLRFTVLPKIEAGGSRLSFDLDYYVDNCKVKFSNTPAVTAVVDNGVLTELKMQIKTIKKTENQTETSAVFDAIDDYFEKKPQTKELKQGKQSYSFSENGSEISLQWELEEVK